MSNKKQQIIVHAIRLFSQSNYYQVSMDKISEESNVSKMTIYKYFSTKEMLFKATLFEMNSQFIEKLLCETSEYFHDIERLKAVFLYYNNWFDQENFTGCLFLNSIVTFAHSNPDMLIHAKQNKMMTQQLIESILCFMLKYECVSEISSQIIKLLDGAVICAQIGIEDTPAHNAWKATLALLKENGAKIEGDVNF